MATTFTWSLQNVDLLDSHEGNEDVVYRVVWQCVATSDSGKTKSQIGVVELDVDNITNFTPADQVTKEQIIEWVKSKVAVAVVEKSLMPEVRTISFADNTATNVTIADQIALSNAQAQSEEPPTP
jgi:hypothetical protein